MSLRGIETSLSCSINLIVFAFFLLACVCVFFVSFLQTLVFSFFCLFEKKQKKKKNNNNNHHHHQKEKITFFFRRRQTQEIQLSRYCTEFNLLPCAWFFRIIEYKSIISVGCRLFSFSHGNSRRKSSENFLGMIFERTHQIWKKTIKKTFLTRNTHARLDLHFSHIF